MKYFQKIFLIFLGIFLGVILGVVGIEIYFRLNKKYIFDELVDFSPNPQYLVCCQRSKIFGYELKPNLVINGDRITNSFGMRDKEYTLHKPKGVFRILLLGDSITEIGRWSEYVEDMLNRDGNFEILNAGVRGWQMYQYWAYVKNKALKFNPDLLLIGFCLNDIYCWHFPVFFYDKKEQKVYVFNINKNFRDFYEVIEKVPRLSPYLFIHSHFYRFLICKVHFNRFYGQKNFSFPGDIEIANLSLLIDIKNTMKGSVLAIIFPYLKPLDKYDKNEKYEYETLLKILDKVGIEYLDLTPVFNKYGKDIIKFRSSEDDKIHFNEEANIIKAKVIYKWLVKKIKEYEIKTKLNN